MKPIKQEFEWWFQCASSIGYLYGFDLNLNHRKDIEVNLLESVVMKLSEKLKRTYLILLFDNFLTVQHRSKNF